MFKNIVVEKNIKDKLSVIREMDLNVFNLLSEKLEFNQFTRFKKTIRQLLRKFIAMGIRNSLKTLSKKDVIRKINSSTNTKKKVLFVAGTYAFNLVGISIYLRKTGEYSTSLIIENPWLWNYFKIYFDNVYVYNSNYNVACILLESNPYMVHVQGTHQYYFLGVLAKCLSDAPVVIGFSDIPSLSIISPDELPVQACEKSCSRLNDVSDLDMLSEKFLFQHADGIILAINTKIAGEKLLHRYKSNVPLIEFFPYVCDEFICQEEKHSSVDGKIHIVYGGVIATADKPEEFYSGIQFIGLVKKLVKQGLYFHLYGTPHTSPLKLKSAFPEYTQLTTETSNFTFECGLPPDEAIKEFSKYDFATITSLYGKKQNDFNRLHKKTAIPSKFFTYLSAGIPMIVGEEEANSRVLIEKIEKYDVGIVVNQDKIECLSEIIKECDYEKLLSNVRRAREELSMKNHIGRLIEFYDQVYATKTLKHEAKQPEVLTT